jgi:23S rRNA (guanine745-N1)-methyltransferase
MIGSVSGSPLACPVRGCTLPLARRDRTVLCPRGHAFDVARGGYVNLLQPQDRRSRAAGDTKAAVQARTDLLAAGIGCRMLDEVVRLALETTLPALAVVVDLGCGSGDTLARLADRRPISGIGIDLSTAAAEHAARRFPALTWVVANADRRLPLLDASVDLVLSLHGRRNPAECARVLKASGTLLVALPAADDLIELRAAVQGTGTGRERGEALLAEHHPLFTAIGRSPVRETLTLEPGLLRTVLRATYRGARRSAAAKAEALEAMPVTMSSEIFVLRATSG